MVPKSRALKAQVKEQKVGMRNKDKAHRVFTEMDRLHVIQINFQKYHFVQKDFW